MMLAVLTGHNPYIKPRPLEVIHHHVWLKSLQGPWSYMNKY